MTENQNRYLDNLWKKKKEIFIFSFISILLITSTSTQVVSIEPVAIQEHVYFLNENFNNIDYTFWNGEFTDLSGRAKLKSETATSFINLHLWNGNSPIYLELHASTGAYIKFYSQGHLLFETMATTEIIDVTTFFIGFRSLLYSSPLAAYASQEKSIQVVIGSMDETFDQLLMYSNLEYSLTADPDFSMDFAVQDRLYAGQMGFDKPIYLGPNNYVYASQIASNARSFRLYNPQDGVYSSLLGSYAADIAGQHVIIPNTPGVMVDVAAAISTTSPIPAHVTISYRVHFLTSANEVPGISSVISDWEFFTSPISELSNLDVSRYSGMRGQFTVEAKITNLYSGDLSPRSPIDFILLQMNLKSETNPVSSSIGSEINAANDYTYLDQDTTVQSTQDGTVLVSSNDGDIAYYMIDTFSGKESASFANGDFYNFFAADEVASPSFEYDEDLGMISSNSGSLNKFEYLLDVETIDFWDPSIFAFTSQLQSVNGKLQGGIAVGNEKAQEVIYYEIAFDSSVPEYDPDYSPKLNIYQSVYSNSSNSFVKGPPIYSKDVEFYHTSNSLDEPLFKRNEKFYLSIFYDKKDETSNIYLIQNIGEDQVITHVDSYVHSHMWSTIIDEVNLIAENGSFFDFNIDQVDQNIVDTLYLETSNPSEREIEVSIISTTPRGDQLSEIVLGNLTLPAGAEMRAYPINVYEDFSWYFFERIKIQKNGLGDTLHIKSLMFEGISQPGFTRSLTHYTHPMNRNSALGDDVRVIDDYIYQSSRLVHADTSATDDLILGMDASFESALNGYSVTGSGYHEVITTADVTQVTHGISSLKISTDSLSEYLFKKQIQFSDPNINKILFDYRASNFIASEDGSAKDHLEVYLYHPSHAIGTSSSPYIPGFENGILRKTAHRSMIYNGITVNENTFGTTTTSTGSQTITQSIIEQNFWRTVSFDVNGLEGLSDPDLWELRIRLVSENHDSNPVMFLDNIRSSQNIDEFLASIPAFLQGGPNKIYVEGMVNFRQVDQGMIYPTLKIGIKELSANTPFTMVGDAFRLTGPNGTKAIGSSSFEIPISGQYDIGVFFDASVNQGNVPIALYTMSHGDVPTSASPLDISGARSNYEGLDIDFTNNGRDTLGGLSKFDEDISYRRNSFSNIVGNRISHFGINRGYSMDDTYLTSDLNTIDASPAYFEMSHDQNRQIFYDRYVVLGDTTISYGVAFNNTRLFVNHLPVSIHTVGDTGSLSVFTGDIIYGTRPVAFTNPDNSHLIAPLSMAATELGFYYSQTKTGVAYIYATVDTNVQYYHNSNLNTTEDQTISLTRNQVYQMSISQGNHLFTSSHDIIITFEGDKGDESGVISSTGTSLFGYEDENIYGVYNGQSFSVDTIGSTNIKYVRSSQPVYGTQVKDENGQNSDADSYMPLSLLSNEYIIHGAINGYVLATTNTDTIKVEYFDSSSSIWVTLNSHSLSGTSTVPDGIVVGDPGSGGDAELTSDFSNVVWRFSSDSSFYLRTNDDADDEFSAFGVQDSNENIDLNYWSSSRLLNAEFLENRIFAKPMKNDDDYVQYDTISHIFPEFSESWTLSISDIGWNILPQDIFSAYLVLYDGNNRRVTFGIQNPNEEASLFEVLITDNSFYTTFDAYPPTSTMNRNLKLIRSGGSLQIIAVMDNTIIEDFIPAFNPTSIAIEVEYNPTAISTSIDLSQSTTFSFGKIRYDAIADNLEEIKSFSVEGNTELISYTMDDVDSIDNFSSSLVSITKSTGISNNLSIISSYPSYTADLATISYTSTFDVPYQISDYDYHMYDLMFWLYVSDIDQMDISTLFVEFGSSLNTQEIQWDASHFDLVSGWNQITLSLEDGTKTGTIDWDSLSLFRIVFAGSGSNAIFDLGLDHISLFSVQKSYNQENLIPASTSQGYELGTLSSGVWMNEGISPEDLSISIIQDDGFQMSSGYLLNYNSSGNYIGSGFHMQDVYQSSVGERFSLYYKYKIIEGINPGFDEILYHSGFEQFDTIGNSVIDRTEVDLGQGWIQVHTAFEINTAGNMYLLLEVLSSSEDFQMIIDDIQLFSMEYSDNSIRLVESSDHIDLDHYKYSNTTDFTQQIIFDIETINTKNTIFSAANTSSYTLLQVDISSTTVDVTIDSNIMRFSHSTSISDSLLDLIIRRSGNNLNVSLNGIFLDYLDGSISNSSLSIEHAILGSQHNCLDNTLDHCGDNLNRLDGIIFYYRFHSIYLDDNFVIELGQVQQASQSPVDNYYTTNAGGFLKYSTTNDQIDGWDVKQFTNVGYLPGSFDGGFIQSYTLDSGDINSISLTQTSNYSLIINGNYLPNTSDIYTFTINVTGGIKIWIDSNPVLSAWNDSVSNTYIFSINMIKNRAYHFRIEQYHTNGTPELILERESSVLNKNILSSSEMIGYASLLKYQYFEVLVDELVGNWILEVTTFNQSLSLNIRKGRNIFNLAALLSNSSILSFDFISMNTQSLIQLDTFYLYTIRNSILSYGNDSTVNSIIYVEGNTLLMRMNNGSDFDTRIDIDISHVDLSTYNLFSIYGSLKTDFISTKLYADNIYLGEVGSNLQSGNMIGLSTSNTFSLEFNVSVFSEIALYELEFYYVSGVDISLTTHNGISPIISSLDSIRAIDGNLVISSQTNSQLFIEFDNFNMNNSRFGEFITPYFDGLGSYTLNYTIGAYRDAFDNDRSLGHHHQRRSFDYSITNNIIGLSQSLYIDLKDEIDLIVSSLKFYNLPDFDLPTTLEADQVVYLEPITRELVVYDGFLAHSFSLADFEDYQNPLHPSLFVRQLISGDTTGNFILDFVNPTGLVNSGRSSVSTTDNTLVIDRSDITDNGFGKFEVGFDVNPSAGNYLVIKLKALTTGGVWLNEIGHNFAPDVGLDQVFWKAQSNMYYFTHSEWSTFVIDLTNSPIDTGSSWKWSSAGGLYLLFEDQGDVLPVDQIAIEFINIKVSPDGGPTYDDSDIAKYWKAGSNTNQLNGLPTTYTGNGVATLVEVTPIDKQEDILDGIENVQIIVSGTHATTSDYDFGYFIGIDYFSLGALSTTPSVFNIPVINITNDLSWYLRHNQNQVITTDVGFSIHLISYKEETMSWVGVDIAQHWDKGLNRGTDIVFDSQNQRTIFSGDTEYPTSPIISTILSPQILRERNILKLDLEVSPDLIGWQIQIYDDNLNSPVYAFYVATINTSARMVYSVNLRSYDFQSFPEIRFVDPTGERSVTNINVYVYSIDFVHENVYTPLSNVAVINSVGGLSTVTPNSNAKLFSLNYLNLLPGERYDGIFVDLIKYNNVTDNSVYEIKISAYDIFGRETILILDHDNASAFKFYTQDDIRKQIFIPFIDDRMSSAIKLLVSIHSNSSFNGVTFEFQTISVVNSKYNYFNFATYTGLESGEFEESALKPFATIDNIDSAGFDASSVLRLRTAASQGLFSLNKDIAPGYYTLSFWMKVYSHQENEVLNVFSSDGTKVITSIQLNDSINHWSHVTLRLNLSQKVSEFDLNSHLIFSLGTDANGNMVGNGLNQTLIYIDDIYLYRSDSDKIVTDEGLDIGSDLQPLVDNIIVPSRSGVSYTLSNLNESVQLHFIPNGGIVLNVSNEIISIADNWVPNLAYRINIIGQLNQLEIGVWYAASARNSGLDLVTLPVIPIGEVGITLSTFIKDQDDYPVILHSRVLPNSKNTGVQGYGSFDVYSSFIHHYDVSKNDALYLTNGNSNRLQVNEFTLEFDYIIYQGSLALLAPGLNVSMGPTFINVNGISINTQSSNLLRFEKYDNSIRIFVNNLQLGIVAEDNTINTENIAFSGFGVYDIANVTSLYSEGVAEDSSTLIMEGNPFTISFSDAVDLNYADEFTFYTEGIVNITTVENENYNILGNGLTYLDVDLLSIATIQPHIQLTNILGYVKIFGFQYSRSGISNPFLSELNGDNRFTIEEGVRNSRYTEVINGYERITSGITGNESPNVGDDYIYLEQELGDGIFEIDFLIEPYGGTLTYLLAEDSSGSRDYIQFNYYRIPIWNNTNPGELLGYNLYSVLELSTASVVQSYMKYEHWEYEEQLTILYDEFGSEYLSTISVQTLVDYKDEWEGLYNGKHTLSIYKQNQQYFAYLNGEAFLFGGNGTLVDPNAQVKWNVGITDSIRSGIGVSRYAHAYNMMYQSSSNILPYGLQTSGTVYSFDGYLDIAGDGYNITTVTSTNSYSLYDINSFNAEFSPVTSATTGEIYLESENYKLGAKFQNEQVYIYYRVYNGNFWENRDVLIGPQVDGQNRDYNLEIEMSPNTPGMFQFTIKLHEITDSNLANNTIIIDDLIPITETFEFVARTADLVTLREIDLSSIDTHEIQQQGETVTVLEGAGHFPAYTIAGNPSYAVKLFDNGQIRRDLQISGSSNSTLLYSLDILVKEELSNTDYFKLKLFDATLSDIELVSIRILGDSLSVSIEGGLNEVIGSIFENTIYSLSISYTKENGAVSVVVQGKTGTFSYNSTLSTPVLQNGDTAALSAYFSSLGNSSIFIDNFAMYGREVDAFVSGNPEDTIYTKYTVFNGLPTKIIDFGPRFLTVSTAALSPLIEMTVHINSIQLETKLLNFDGSEKFEAVVFYIPLSIDTTSLLSVSVHTTANIYFGGLGLYQEEVPNEVLLAGSEVMSDDANAFVHLISASSGSINSNTDRKINLGAHSRSGNLLPTVVNDRINIPASTSDFFDLTKNEIDGDQFGFEVVNSDDIYARVTESKDQYPFTFSSGIDFEENSILTFDSDANDAYWLIVRVEGTAGNGLIGTGSTLPVYLFFEVGNTVHAFPTQEWGISNLVSNVSNSYYAAGDYLQKFLKLSYYHQNIVDTYGWMKFDLEPAQFQTIDLNEYLERFNEKVIENIGSYYYNHQRLVNDLVNLEGYSEQDAENHAINVNTVQYGDTPTADYTVRYSGFDGFAIATDQDMLADNFALIKDPTRKDFAPAEGRISTYFNDQVWKSVITTDSGYTILDEVAPVMEDDHGLSLISLNINSEIESTTKLRLFTNMPVLIYADDNLVTTFNSAFSAENITEKLIEFRLPGGSTDLLILAIHTSDEFSGPRTDSNTYGVDKWKVAFSIIADLGNSYSLSSSLRPGLEGNYLDNFAGSNNIYRIEDQHFQDEFSTFVNTIPLPGENYVLLNQPEKSMRIKRISASNLTGTVPMIRPIDQAIDRINMDSPVSLDGVYFAMTNILLTEDMVDNHLILRFISNNSESLKAIIINEFLITGSGFTGPSVTQDIQIIHLGTDADVTGTSIATTTIKDLNIIQENAFDGVNDAIEFALSLSSGVHTIAMAIENPLQVNATTAYFDKLMDVGVEVLSGIPNGSAYDYVGMPDSIRSIIEPISYDPMNYISSTTPTITLDFNSDSAEAARFSPLEKQVEGVDPLKSSWFVSPDGGWHLKREISLGFKDDLGPCQYITEQEHRTGLLYTHVVVDPYTPQMSSMISEQWVSTQADDDFNTPLQVLTSIPSGPQGLAEQEYYNLQQAVSIHQTTKDFINNRYDTLSLDDFSISINNVGYRFSIDGLTEYMVFDQSGKIIDIEFTSVFESSNDTLNSMELLTIPESSDTMYISSSETDFQLSSSFSSAYTLSNSSIGKILFVTQFGSTGILYPQANVLDMITSSGFEINYRLLTGSVRIHELGTGMATNFYKGQMSNWFDLDWYSRERDAEHTTIGALDNPVQAFVFANLAMLNDPSFDAAYQDIINEQEEAQRYETMRDALRFSKIGQAVLIGVNVATWLVDASQAYQDGELDVFLTETWNGQVQNIRDAIGSVGDWTLESLTQGLVFICDVAFNILGNFVNIIIGTIDYLMDTWNEFMEGPVSEFLNGISSKVSEFLIMLETSYGNWDDSISDFDLYNVTAALETEALLASDFNSTSIDMPEHYNFTTLYQSAVMLGLPDPLVNYFKYQDIINQALMQMVFLTFWGGLFGTAYGFEYSLEMLFPGVNYEDYVLDHTSEWVPTKLVDGQLLQIDKPMSWMDSKSKDKFMRKMAASIGWSIGYDPAPVGAAPSDPEVNFNNFNIIARRNPSNTKWIYLLGLSDSMKIPITLSTVMAVITGGSSSALKLAMRQMLKTTQVLLLNNYFGHAAGEAFENGSLEGIDESLTITTSTGYEMNVVEAFFHATSLFLGFDPGIVIGLGGSEFGLIGLSELLGLANDPLTTELCAGYGCDETDPNSYQTDEYGRQTQERRFNFNVGVSEKTFMFIVELALNFIPLWGSAISVFQDLRDAIIGDSAIDRLIGWIVLPISIADLGKRFSTSKAIKETTQITTKKAADDLLKEAAFENPLLEYTRQAMQSSKTRSWVKGALYPIAAFGEFASRLNRHGGGGVAGAIRTELTPLFLLKKILFSPFDILFSRYSADYADKLIIRAQEKAIHEARRVFEEGLRRSANDIAAEAAAEADRLGWSEDAAREAGNLARIQYMADNSEALGLLENKEYITRFNQATKRYADLLIAQRDALITSTKNQLGLFESAGFTLLSDPSALAKHLEGEEIIKKLKDHDDILREATNAAGEEVFGPIYAKQGKIDKFYSPLGSILKLLIATGKAFGSFGTYYMLLREGALIPRKTYDAFKRFFHKLIKGTDYGVFDQTSVYRKFLNAIEKAESDPYNTILKNANSIDSRRARSLERQFQNQINIEYDFRRDSSLACIASLNMFLHCPQNVNIRNQIVGVNYEKFLKYTSGRTDQKTTILSIIYKEPNGKTLPLNFKDSNPSSWFSTPQEFQNALDSNSLNPEFVSILKDAKLIDTVNQRDVLNNDFIHISNNPEAIIKYKIAEIELLKKYLARTRILIDDVLPGVSTQKNINEINDIIEILEYKLNTFRQLNLDRYHNNPNSIPSGYTIPFEYISEITEFAEIESFIRSIRREKDYLKKVFMESGHYEEFLVDVKISEMIKGVWIKDRNGYDFRLIILVDEIDLNLFPNAKIVQNNGNRFGTIIRNGEAKTSIIPNATSSRSKKIVAHSIEDQAMKLKKFHTELTEIIPTLTNDLDNQVIILEKLMKHITQPVTDNLDYISTMYPKMTNKMIKSFKTPVNTKTPFNMLFKINKNGNDILVSVHLTIDEVEWIQKSITSKIKQFGQNNPGFTDQQIYEIFSESGQIRQVVNDFLNLRKKDNSFVFPIDKDYNNARTMNQVLSTRTDGSLGTVAELQNRFMGGYPSIRTYDDYLHMTKVSNDMSNFASSSVSKSNSFSIDFEFEGIQYRYNYKSGKSNSPFVNFKNSVKEISGTKSGLSVEWRLQVTRVSDGKLVDLSITTDEGVTNQWMAATQFERILTGSSYELEDIYSEDMRIPATPTTGSYSPAYNDVSITGLFTNFATHHNKGTQTVPTRIPYPWPATRWGQVHEDYLIFEEGVPEQTVQIYKALFVGDNAVRNLADTLIRKANDIRRTAKGNLAPGMDLIDASKIIIKNIRDGANYKYITKSIGVYTKLTGLSQSASRTQLADDLENYYVEIYGRFRTSHQTSSLSVFELSSDEELITSDLINPTIQDLGYMFDLINSQTTQGFYEQGYINEIEYMSSVYSEYLDLNYKIAMNQLFDDITSLGSNSTGSVYYNATYSNDISIFNFNIDGIELSLSDDLQNIYHEGYLFPIMNNMSLNLDLFYSDSKIFDHQIPSISTGIMSTDYDKFLVMLLSYNEINILTSINTINFAVNPEMYLFTALTLQPQQFDFMESVVYSSEINEIAVKVGMNLTDIDYNPFLINDFISIVYNEVATQLLMSPSNDHNKLGLNILLETYSAKNYNTTLYNRFDSYNPIINFITSNNPLENIIFGDFANLHYKVLFDGQVNILEHLDIMGSFPVLEFPYANYNEEVSLSLLTNFRITSRAFVQQFGNNLNDFLRYVDNFYNAHDLRRTVRFSDVITFKVRSNYQQVPNHFQIFSSAVFANNLYIRNMILSSYFV